MRTLLKFILVFGLGSLAHGATAFVQYATLAHGTSAGTTGTITFAGNMTAGNAVIVLINTGLLNFTVMPAPTITGATCWPLRFADGDMAQSGNTGYLSAWVCPNVPGGAATVSITVSTSFTVNFNAAAYEFIGLGAWPTFDQAPSTWPSYGEPIGQFASGSGNAMSVTGSTTLGALVIGFGAQNNALATCSAGTGFTQPTGGTLNSTWTMCSEYQLSSAGGATTVTQNSTASAQWAYHFISILPGSTPYTGTPTQSNGYFVQRSTIHAFGQHALTDAFPVLAVLPNGNIGMAYEQDSDGGQGSGPNSTAAFASSSNGGTSWTDYSGATQGSQCATLATPGCVFSGDGLAADSHWFEGYYGLVVNGSNTYYTVGVETSGGSCVKAMLSISTDSGTTWGTLINVDTNSACWVAPPIFIPGGSVSSLCPTGCIIAPVDEAGTFKFLFSTDGGNTWPTSQTLPTAPFNQLEDYCWWNGGNQIICVARSFAAQPLRVASTPDFGATWTVTAYTNTVTNAAALYSSAWQLTSPVVVNPNLGDGKLSILFGDRGAGQIRLINTTLSTLLNSPSSIGQGEVLASFAPANTEGYEAACLVSGNTWLFAWYAQNGLFNGQIFTMQGSYISPTVTLAPQLFAKNLP